MSDLFDSSGKKVPLGKKLGSGGEGAVYDVPALGSEFVAKVYHQQVSHDRQAKLQAMAAGCDESLRRISAWPLQTLHGSPSGPIRGFVMPKVNGYEPIHHLYGPSHRKQLFPDRDWAFLINAARNTAAAFDVIHGHGHVVGDVNPNLVFVAPNSVVKLIDCDSFQIAAENRHFLCEVGVPHFTPPELQNHPTFKGIRRTANHDNFGLALLIFHILLMGRHPFSGVFSGKGDMALEKAIAEFRYAFGRNASTKLMAPPPNSVTPSILPQNISRLFERAFTEEGTQGGARPTARQWLDALDALRSELRDCGQQPIHKFFHGAGSCPWCFHEQQSGIFFFVSLTSSFDSSHFDLGQSWARILTVASPGPAPQVSFGAFSVTPAPLPQSVVQAKALGSIKKVAAVAVVVGSIAIAPKALIIALIVAAFLFFSSTDDSPERKTRQQAVESARASYSSVLSRWQTEVGETPFQNKLQELSRYRTEYQNLGNQIAQAKQALQANVRNAQLHKFLDRFFIDAIDIPGIGPTRKSTLASFGIETAADVVAHRIKGIKGFGDKLTRELVDWRKGIERRFVFDPSKGVDPADLAAINQRFAQKRKDLEGKLLAGHEQLCLVRSQVLQKRGQLMPAVESASRQLAQAEADLAALNSSGFTSGGVVKWAIGLVVVLFVLFVIGNSGKQSPPSTYAQSATSAAQSTLPLPPPSTATKYQPSASMPRKETIPDGGQQDRNMASGASQPPSPEEIRQCLTEKVRLEAIEGVLSSSNDLEVSRFDQLLRAYNTRCESVRLKASEKEMAEVEAARSDIVRLAQSEWVRNSLGLVSPPLASTGDLEKERKKIRTSDQATIEVPNQSRDLDSTIKADKAETLAIREQRPFHVPGSKRSQTIPENARLAPWGDDWICNHGFRKAGNQCIKVEVPLNAKIAPWGSDWVCNHGYRKVGNQCTEVEIPANAKIAPWGSDWVCNHGFRKEGSQCTKVEVPPNAKIASWGSDWVCLHGYRKEGNECVKVEVPPNGRLASWGYDWVCNQGFQKHGKECIPATTSR